MLVISCIPKPGLHQIIDYFLIMVFNEQYFSFYEQYRLFSLHVGPVLYNHSAKPC